MPISAAIVVVIMMIGVGIGRSSGSGDASDVSHERFVLSSVTSLRVSKVPASDTVVVETFLVSAEVRSLLHCAHAAQCIL